MSKPPITLSSLDLDRIEALLAAIPASVFPNKAQLHMDGSTDRVSIFAPVGSALLGLSVGDSLAWPGPGGKTMTVHVTEIIYQPERAGELHR